jgi:Cys-tRNA(Pro)/Cys-tRNA(Cys) deacylase
MSEGVMSPAVLSFLTSSNAIFTVHEHGPVVTFREAQLSLPFDPDAMVKSLAFRLPGDRYAIAAMRAAERADYKKIADALGVKRADLQMATDVELVQALAMVPGGVAPLPINNAQVVIDLGVTAMETIYCGTGRNDSTLEIRSAELLRINRDALRDLVKR